MFSSYDQKFKDMLTLKNAGPPELWDYDRARYIDGRCLHGGIAMVIYGAIDWPSQCEMLVIVPGDAW